MWLVAGGTSSTLVNNERTNEVWTSLNVVHWRQINSSATRFWPRMYAAGGIDRRGNKILMSGVGVNYSSLAPGNTDVWMSRVEADDSVWILVTVSTPMLQRRVAQFVTVWSDVLSRDIYTFIGGSDNYQLLNDGQLTQHFNSAQHAVAHVAGTDQAELFLCRFLVWVSSDLGVTWTELLAAAPFARDTAPIVVTSSVQHHRRHCCHSTFGVCRIVGELE